ncbi:MAG: hypothetical protein MUE49_09980 [Rhodospirillales bacterium]|nr:hypothetical protein [Rhodospirillales bacterium]
MKRAATAALFAATLMALPAFAQDPGMSFDDAAYVTCREADAMAREKRVALAVALVQRAAAHYGVTIGDGSAAETQVAGMLRAGCTLFPDAYVQTLAALAVRRQTSPVTQSVLPTPPLPFDKAVFLTCEQYAQMTDVQQDTVEFDLAVHAGRRYGMRFADTAAERAKLDDGITPLVYGACNLLPDLYVYKVVARAVQSAAEKARAAR